METESVSYRVRCVFVSVKPALDYLWVTNYGDLMNHRLLHSTKDWALEDTHTHAFIPIQIVSPHSLCCQWRRCCIMNGSHMSSGCQIGQEAA